MKRKYDRGFNPPAPVVPIVVMAPDGVDAIELGGKLDSGADLCALPDDCIAELDLPPVRTLRAAGFSGLLSEVIAYRMDLEIDRHRLRRIEVIATRRSYAILGRNVLRHFVVRLDGPKEQLELRRPKRAKA